MHFVYYALELTFLLSDSGRCKVQEQLSAFLKDVLKSSRVINMVEGVEVEFPLSAVRSGHTIDLVGINCYTH